jgi:hypothetical protein
MDLREAGCEMGDGGWIKVAQDRVQWRTLDLRFPQAEF